MPLLAIKNVETYYGLIYALKGVSLSIEPGTVTAIIGNNGAGKTTLLKTVMGLIDDQPEKGSIEWKGARITHRDPEQIVRLGISYVPEGREVWEELSVRENLLMGAYIRNKRSVIRKDLDDVYAAFPVLREREDQLAGTLSGGEQQMLAIGRALMNAPELLLLDEPSLGLSPLLVKTIFGIISSIRERGVTIVLVEQNARMALQIADYGYVMENGRMVLAGEAPSLMENRDVQEFYLGIRKDVSVKGYQRWKRKKRWQ